MTDAPRPDDPNRPHANDADPTAASGSATGASMGAGASGERFAGSGAGSGAGYGGGAGSYGAGAGYSTGSSGTYGGGAGSRLFDDLARFVTDAAGATQGVRREVEQVMRAQGEAVLGRMDVVRRDEHEAVAEMASRARAENETLRGAVEMLEARVNALEARLGASEAGREGVREG